MDNIVVKNKSKEYCLNVIKPFFEANGYISSLFDEFADNGGCFSVVSGTFWWGSDNIDIEKAQLIELPEPEFPKKMWVWDDGNKDKYKDIIYGVNKEGLYIGENDNWEHAEDIEPEKKTKTLSEILKEYASEKYPDCEVIDDLQRKDVRVK